MYLELKNVSKEIKRNKVLKNITIDMEKGRIYGFRGRNGSGKTMLMRIICGLITASEGEVIINNEVLGKDISFPRSIGALIENPEFIDYYTAEKNLQILASIKNEIGEKEIKDILSTLDLVTKKKFKTFSLGMKQKLGIAAALMEKPDIVVLDEPVNALDEATVSIVKDMLLERKKDGSLCIISCHDKEELEFLCDEIFCINNGEITDHYIVEKGA